MLSDRGYQFGPSSRRERSHISDVGELAAFFSAHETSSEELHTQAFGGLSPLDLVVHIDSWEATVVGSGKIKHKDSESLLTIHLIGVTLQSFERGSAVSWSRRPPPPEFFPEEEGVGPNQEAQL